jgi:branched-chain amino acid transport system substrate-binding protein
MRRKIIAAAALVATALTGCSGATGGAGEEGTIKIGASLPITGPLAAFGELIEAGYQELVDDVNAEGGIEVDGTKREVELIIRDSESEPDTVSEQSRSLVLNDEVVALLGSVSPPLTIPASNVAERERVPFVTSLTPLQAWKGANQEGWTYAWDIFFDELEMTDNQFLASDLVETNKKIALFTDNEEDGIVMGQLWEDKAADMGYEVAYRAEFPVGTTDYATFIAEAKSAGAEILIAQMIPPDAFALWKQMKALSFAPKVAYCEKCAAQGAFQRELGDLAEGTITTDFVQSSDDETAARLTEVYGEKYGKNLDLSTIIVAYSAAKVLTDAIARAGSADPEAINEAIQETSGLYPLGYEISFDDDNSFAVPPAAVQWRGVDTVQVYPDNENSVPLESPVAGLQ